jgi:hypothetical protein
VGDATAVDGTARERKGIDHVRHHQGADRARWEEGYAACLADLNRVDREHGTTRALGILVEWLRDPAATARLAWRGRAS